ncbi:MAG: glycosyltransferase family 1 protein [Bacteroidales bacterium]|nr:glycosyltransferase family 1 protein [Bacteroidales bacterium]
MILGINASNLRAGGGVTHLVEILRVSEPRSYGFEKVIVWGGEETLSKVTERDWLHKIHDPLLDRSFIYRLFWQTFRLKKLAKQSGCDILFVPGGSNASRFKPVVTMSRNMLPFEWREMRRFGWSLFTVKLLLLRVIQSHTFRNANGVIFLTKYARNRVLNVTGSLRGKSMIIPHGINPRFFRLPRRQRLCKEFIETEPCRVLYVSIVDAYKHQTEVAIAVARLRSEGVFIVLELIGPSAKGINRLNKTLSQIDPKSSFIKYRGSVPYEKLDEFYDNVDISVFASSCENMPNILLECMAAGLPMACSSMGPMPEILGDAGVYFNPEDANEIALALYKLIDSPSLREQSALTAYLRAQQYSWERCADGTFGFLADIAQI